MLVKALVEWLASLWYEMVENILNSLLGVFTTDLSYFAARVPVITDMRAVLLAVGWALLIGNLVFQLTRSMASGIGLKGEEPQLLFTRSFLFSFLLVASPQICDIGLAITSTVTTMIGVPTAVTFTPFSEDYFTAMPNAGWFVVIIINIMIQWQFIKLFFEIAERYVILCVLTYCAPLAFSMGGARSTSPSGLEIVPWALFITGIVRVAKKMDGIILRIGLNPASTGDPLGHRLPGMLAMTVARALGSTLSSAAAANGGAPKHSSPGGAHGAGYSGTPQKPAHGGAHSRPNPASGGLGARGAAGRKSADAAASARTTATAAHTTAAAQSPGAQIPPLDAQTPPVHSQPGAGRGAAAATPRTVRRPGPTAAQNDAEARRIRHAINIVADPDFDNDVDAVPCHCAVPRQSADSRALCLGGRRRT